MKRTKKVRNIKWLFIAAALFLCMSACGREAVLLEESDLVQVEEKGADEERVPLKEEKEETEQVEESTLFVHICGEVLKPGVYELPLGSRIYEAVEAAGGFTEAAQESAVNLACLLEDGWKVEIPSVEAAEKEEAKEGIYSGSAVGTDLKESLIDINKATKQELCSLPGIGESRADSIIAYREKNGGFGRIEDIMKVEGIKEGMFDKLKDRICVRGVR